MTPAAENLSASTLNLASQNLSDLKKKTQLHRLRLRLQLHSHDSKVTTILTNNGAFLSRM